jgi:hypothetical protein
VSDASETLGWEAEKRPRAGAAALAAAVLTLVSAMLYSGLSRGSPDDERRLVGFPDALRTRLEGGQPRGDSLSVQQTDYLGDHLGQVIGAALAGGLAVAAACYALYFLFRATKARMPELGRAALIAAVIAAVAFPVGHVVRNVGQALAARDFADARERTPGAARELIEDAPVLAGALIENFGAFALAVAFVLVCLNAMRVGLLTRFLGILGIVTGALTVFQLDRGLLRIFWLCAIGLLILRRWPGGVPPAWETGRAEPWPSAADVRAQREAAAGRAPLPEPAAAPESASQPAGVPHPSSKKRKRKRRR